jgi:hypothetical protein
MPRKYLERSSIRTDCEIVLRMIRVLVLQTMTLAE